eukprot:3716017-Heterocapsa_arctica.AAC.1
MPCASPPVPGSGQHAPTTTRRWTSPGGSPASTPTQRSGARRRADPDASGEVDGRYLLGGARDASVGVA